MKTKRENKNSMGFLSPETKHGWYEMGENRMMHSHFITILFPPFQTSNVWFHCVLSQLLPKNLKLVFLMNTKILMLFLYVEIGITFRMAPPLFHSFLEKGISH